MGIDLVGPGGNLHSSWLGWSSVLRLGRVYGWEPEETGDFYQTNGDNRVSDEDASKLACALEKGLRDLAARPASWTDGLDPEECREELSTGKDDGISRSGEFPNEQLLNHWDSIDGRYRLREFTLLCRRGGFTMV